MCSTVCCLLTISITTHLKVRQASRYLAKYLGSKISGVHLVFIIVPLDALICRSLLYR